MKVAFLQDGVDGNNNTTTPRRHERMFCLLSPHAKNAYYAAVWRAPSIQDDSRFLAGGHGELKVLVELVSEDRSRVEYWLQAVTRSLELSSLAVAAEAHVPVLTEIAG